MLPGSLHSSLSVSSPLGSSSLSLSTVLKSNTDQSPPGSTLRTIFAHWNQTATATGRLSTTAPNLQSLPRDPIEIGSGTFVCVRNAFVIADARTMTLVSADYSQVEMRMFAHASGCARMIALFTRDDGGDIYRRMAALCFRRPLAMITQQERQLAKAVSLGIIYGLGAKHLADQLNEFLLRTSAVTPAGKTTKKFSEKDAKVLIASKLTCMHGRMCVTPC